MSYSPFEDPPEYHESIAGGKVKGDSRPASCKLPLPLTLEGKGADAWVSDNDGRAVVSRTEGLTEEEHVSFLEWIIAQASCCRFRFLKEGETIPANAEFQPSPLNKWIRVDESDPTTLSLIGRKWSSLFKPFRVPCDNI